MNLGIALDQVAAGKRATRASWPAGQWLILVPGSTITVDPTRPLGAAAPELVGKQVAYGSHVDLFADGALTPWTPSQADMLAADWQTVTPPAPPPLLLGNAYATDLALYPGQTIGITFNKPGTGLSISKVKAVPAGIMPIVCVKDVITAKMLDDLIAALAGRPAWLVEHQEPEGDLPPADYIAQQLAVAKLLAARPGCGITQTGKLTDYAEVHGKGPWTTWFASRPGKPVERIMAVDLYVNDPTAADYPDPAAVIAPWLAAAKAAGVPLAFTEVGVVLLKSDPDGTKLAAWMVKFIAAIRAQIVVQVLAVLWWDGPGTKTNFTLVSKPRAEWRRLVATQANS